MIDVVLIRHTTFLISATPLADTAPLHLLIPGVSIARTPLLQLVRTTGLHLREQDLDLEISGADAESLLLDYWTDLPAEQRRRVWGVISPRCGALARFPDRPASGFALLSSSHADDDEPPHAQCRSLLAAMVPDAWALALEDTSPVDEAIWRAHLDEALRFWTIAWLESPTDALRAFETWLGRACLEVMPPSSWPEATQGTACAPRGWLEHELVANRWAERSIAAPHLTAPSPAVSPEAGQRGAAKVVRGRRGRLFLSKDSHDSHRQITGGRSLTTSELDAWQQGLDTRVANLDALGCHYRLLLGPAPQVVHAEDLPEGVSVSLERPAVQLLARLEPHVRAGRFLYPLAPLQRMNATHDPFSKTDSHWNDLGTYLAYEALMATLPASVPVRRLTRDEVTFLETCYVGDLGVKLTPQRASMFLRARIDPAAAVVVEDNRVRNHGRRAVFRCDAAPASTCLVFGDSWAYSLMLFLAESFRRVVFFHRVNVIDRAPILAERPDVVISVLTERFCTALPDAPTAGDFDRVVARKLELEDTIPDPIAEHTHPYLFSLALDRGLGSRQGGFRLAPDT